MDRLDKGKIKASCTQVAWLRCCTLNTGSGCGHSGTVSDLGTWEAKQEDFHQLKACLSSTVSSRSPGLCRESLIKNKKADLEPYLDNALWTRVGEYKENSRSSSLMALGSLCPVHDKDK